MPNRKDVALKANVSITVVSRVMSGTGYVSKEKREAVLRAAEELNYRPSPVARSLQNGQTRQILFYRGNLSSAYYLELHRGMMDYAEQQGYLVCVSGGLHIERIGELLIDGLILPTEAYARPEYLKYLRKYHIPYVVIGYGEPIPKNVYSVTVDTGLAMRKLVEYVRQKGHRRIAFVNRVDTSPEGPRNNAFHSLMAEAYHDSPGRIEDYILNIPVTGHEAGSVVFYQMGRAAAEQFAQRRLDATAVICFNDEAAVGFSGRIATLGYRIPEDLSVAGFDGIALGEYITPALTSMALHPYEQGKKCAEVILDLLQGKRCGYKHDIDVSLVERESVRARR
ncbi:MAG: LacI family transcriptional regulator [Spirochaetaceae bacterium]|jgi:DNA-binding LacI/PurR family transcriptional regulator|nr:LacI family transcriptional regulator [Spirochaetaceae bacterium]